MRNVTLHTPAQDSCELKANLAVNTFKSCRNPPLDKTIFGHKDHRDGHEVFLPSSDGIFLDIGNQSSARSSSRY